MRFGKEHNTVQVIFQNRENVIGTVAFFRIPIFQNKNAGRDSIQDYEYDQLVILVERPY
jgi:hypothetical protein